jgi:hypothetical protein
MVSELPKGASRAGAPLFLSTIFETDDVFLARFQTPVPSVCQGAVPTNAVTLDPVASELAKPWGAVQVSSDAAGSGSSCESTRLNNGALLSEIL